MLRFIMLLIGAAVSIFLISLTIRYLLKITFAWDTRICNKRGSSFCGFRRHLRMPFAIGVIPEFFYFMVIGGNNYFNARWWALRAGSYISFLIFIAALFNRTRVMNYYSWSFLKENGISAYISLDSGMWSLNIINFLFLVLLALILVESIKMHKAWAPVRFLSYSLMAVLMAYISVMMLALIISFTILYICYKIIKFFWSSNRRKLKVDVDDDDDPSDKLNNTYRQFRSELYAWEDERREIRADEKKTKKVTIKRKRPKIERKPRKKTVDDDIPRFHPE